MPTPSLSLVIQRLRRFVLLRNAGGLTDERLLEAFIKNRDEAAFETIVRRHGAMVMGVCRRVLRSHHDAEDAFQATFLVLARKAASIASREAVAHWLYCVAFHAALKAKMATAKRRLREREGADMPKVNASPSHDQSDLHDILDQELHRLPAKYRAPIVLCDLEGKTRKEAAAQLGCPEGTVAGRLARARAMLAKRLTQRGVALSGAVFVDQQSLSIAAAGVPISLIVSTSKAAALFTAEQKITSIVSAKVAALVTGVLQSMFVTKIKSLAIVAFALATFGGGGLLVGTTSTQVRGTKADKTPTNPRTVQNDAKKNSSSPSPQAINETQIKDSLGDALPPHALARLGTVRLRHDIEVNKAAFSPGETTLISADRDGAYVWDAATGRRLRQFLDTKNHRDFQKSLAFSADNTTMAIPVKKEHVTIWDTANVRLRCQFQIGPEPLLQLSPDGKMLAVLENGTARTGSVKSLCLYDASMGVQLHRLIGPFDPSGAFAFTHDGKTLVTSSSDQALRFWDVVTGKQVRELKLPVRVSRIVLSPDDRFFATLPLELSKNKDKLTGNIYWTFSERIILFDLESGKEIHRLPEQKKNSVYRVPQMLAFSPDGKSFISSDGRVVRWWDVATGQESLKLNLPIPLVHNVSFSRDGKTLVAAGQPAIQVWDLETRQPKHSSVGHNGPIRSVATSPDGRFFATGSMDSSVRLWDSGSGAVVREFIGHEGEVKSLRFTPNGKSIVSASTDETVRVWDVATGKEVRLFPGIETGISHDGIVLATHSKDNVLHIYDLSTGQERGQWTTNGICRIYGAYPSDGGAPLLLSPDGRIISYFSNDRKVCVVETATGKMLRQFEVHHFREFNDNISSIALSPDGRLAAFGGTNSAIALYEMASGKHLATLSAGFNARDFICPTALVFSADSRILASARWQAKTVHVWELATRKEFQRFAGHKGDIQALAFSADGMSLVSGSLDATGLVWDLTSRARKTIATPLSEENLKAFWTELGNNEADVAQRAVGILAALPSQVLPLCQRHLRPIPVIDAKKMAQLFARLNDEGFQEGAAAIRELEELGDAAELALRRELENSPPLEVRRRIDVLLSKLVQSSERLRNVRILQLLERSGTPDTRDLLRSLAEGAAGAWLTKEAQMAVERLARRP